jgi:hypothetical protein
MGLRDRITTGISDVGDRLKEEVAEFVAGPDGASSVEGFILGIVRSARDEEDGETSAKHVRKEAKKRRRRLGLASFAAGPLAGIAGEVTDLYTETATVCDVVELHALPLSDAQIGGHMLALWGFIDDPVAAAAALDGSGVPIAALLAVTVNARYQAAETVPAKIKVIWENRDVMSGVREQATSGAFSRVLRAGRDSKDVIERAEIALGVRPA